MILDSVALTLLVRSFDEAIEFYVDQTRLFAIETDIGESDSRTVCLYLRELCRQFVLHLFESVRENRDSAMGRQSDQLVFLNLPVPSVEILMANLHASKIPIIDRTELPYGESLIIKDPFGNKLNLFERHSGKNE